MNLHLDLTNDEAAALYTQTHAQRDELAKVMARPADNQTEGRAIAYNVLGRIASALLEHDAEVREGTGRLRRCRKCGWVDGSGHADGCPVGRAK